MATHYSQKQAAILGSSFQLATGITVIRAHALKQLKHFTHEFCG